MPRRRKDKPKPGTSERPHYSASFLRSAGVAALMGGVLALSYQWITLYFSLTPYLAKALSYVAQAIPWSTSTLLPAFITQSVWLLPLTFGMVTGLCSHYLYQKRGSMFTFFTETLPSWAMKVKSSVVGSSQSEPTKVITQEHSFKDFPFVSQVIYAGKVTLANLLTKKMLVRLARVKPQAGQLFEYTHLTDIRGIDIFHHFVSTNEYEWLKEVIKYASVDSLNVMLSRLDGNKESAICHMILKKRIVELELIVEKIGINAFCDHLKIEHFTGDQRLPLAHQIINNIDLFKGYRLVWDLLLKYAKKEELRELLAGLDFKNDSIFQKFGHLRTIMIHDKILNIYDSSDMTHYLTKVCPHETTPMLELLYRMDSESIFQVLKKIDKDVWTTVVEAKPEHWTMTHGEKMLIAAYMGDMHFRNQERNKPVVPVLEKKYGLTLPTNLQELKKENYQEFKELIRQMSVIRRKETCIKLQKQWLDLDKELPEKILGKESFLPINHYTKAWRRAQLKWHPDKNSNNPQAADKSALLNQAHTYLTTEEPIKKIKWRSF